MVAARGDRRAPRRDRGHGHGGARRHRLIAPHSHEPASVSFRARGRAPQPQSHRDRQGALHLAARHQQGHHRAGGRARRRDLRAPRQAAAPHHRARPAGAEVGRGDHARGGQPQAHRRGVFQAGRRHAVDRHHAHAGALLPARAGGRAAQALSQGAGGAASGHAGAGGAHAAGRLRRDRPGHRVAGRRRRSGHAALLRVAARDRGAGVRIRWPRWSGRRWSSSPPSRW